MALKTPNGRCKTFIIDPPFLFTAGCLLAFVSRRQLVARKPNPFGLSAWVTVGFALFFWASVTWFVVHAPDWMLSYFIPASEVPLFWAHGLFAVALVVASLSGHTLTATMLQRSSLVGAVCCVLAGLALWGGLWILTLDRYMVVGSHADFVAGTAQDLQQSSILGAMNVVGALQGLAGVGAMAWLFTRGRQLRAR
mgnify:CR=1 FL=1